MNPGFHSPSIRQVSDSGNYEEEVKRKYMIVKAEYFIHAAIVLIFTAMTVQYIIKS